MWIYLSYILGDIDSAHLHISHVCWIGSAAGSYVLHNIMDSLFTCDLHNIAKGDTCQYSFAIFQDKLINLNFIEFIYIFYKMACCVRFSVLKFRYIQNFVLKSSHSEFISLSWQFFHVFRYSPSSTYSLYLRKDTNNE